MENKIYIRKGRREDCIVILKLINDLVEYLNKDKFDILISDFIEDGFGEHKLFELLVAEIEISESVNIIGYALYYYEFSTYLGKCSTLEDLYVLDEYRNHGVEKLLLQEVSKIVLRNGVIRVDCCVSTRNENLVKLFTELGAVDLTKTEDWNSFRLKANFLSNLAYNDSIMEIGENEFSLQSTKMNLVIRRGEKKDCSEILQKMKQFSLYLTTGSHYKLMVSAAVLFHVPQFLKVLISRVCRYVGSLLHINYPSAVKIGVLTLERYGFGADKLFETFVAEVECDEGRKMIGYALYFFSYSIFVGRSCFMEDIYIDKDYRNLGLGSALWKAVAMDAIRNNCQEMEFVVLGWNTRSMKFYEKFGAYNYTKAGNGNYFRFDKDAMEKMTRK